MTEGPIVAELCAAAGFAPDPQQELGLDMIFAVGADGLPASFGFCVVCCRQNMKTGLFKQAAIGWVYVTDERKIVWSAHEMATTNDAKKELGELLQDAPMLAKRLPDQKNRGIYADNGAERIEFATGQQILFKPRTLGSGRGLTGDKVILDEAFALKPAHVGSLLPTMAARPGGQVLYGSSAGKSDSVVLYDVRERGRNAVSPRLSYLEWGGGWRECRVKVGEKWVNDPDCAHPKDAVQRGLDCVLDDQELWRRNNPTISTGRITLEMIAAQRQELPPDEFAREFMGRWDEPDSGAGATFGMGRWEACARQLEDDEVPEAPAAIGVAVSVDRTWASIAMATPVEVVEDPEDPEAEPVDRIYTGALDRREEVAWLVEALEKLQVDYPDAVIVIDEKGPTRALLESFEDADIAVETTTLEEYVEACARYFDKVRSRTLIHPSSQELDDAVNGAVWRDVGDGRRVWGRRQSTKDVSMLEASTLAVYGAEKFTFSIY
jgi:hypothetical protein